MPRSPLHHKPRTRSPLHHRQCGAVQGCPAQGCGFVTGFRSPQSLEGQVNMWGEFIRNTLQNWGSRLSPGDCLPSSHAPPIAGHDFAHRHTHVRGIVCVCERALFGKFHNEGVQLHITILTGLLKQGSIRGGMAGKSGCGSEGLTCMKDISTLICVYLCCHVPERNTP